MLGTGLLTAVMGSGLLRLELETDGAALYPPDHPTVRRTAADRETFYDQEQVILLVSERRGGLRLSSPRGFAFLRDLERSIRRLPGVRSSGVRSLASLTDLRIGPDSIAASPFLDAIAQEPAAFASQVRRLRQNPLTDALLLSPAGTSAALYVPRIAGHDRKSFLRSLRSFRAARGEAPFELQLTGPLVAEALLGEMILSDLGHLIPLMVAVIFVLLLALLRTLGGVLVPFAAMVVVLVCTLGAMGFVGIPVTLVTTLLPVILMAMAITDEVHLLERLQGNLGLTAGSSFPQAAVRQRLARALLAALGELERPIVATSMTTSLAFLAFLFTSIEPLRYFGLMSAAGILLALVLTFTTIPAIIVLLPVRWLVPAKAAGSGRLLAYERLAARHAGGGWVVVCGLLLGLPGLRWLRVEDNWIANFDPESEWAQAEREFNRSFWGTHRFDVVLCGAEELFHGSAGARLIEEVSRLSASAPGVVGTLSYLVPVAEVQRAQGDRRAPSLLASEQLADLMTLAMMSEDPFGLLHFVTSDGACARVELFLKSEDYRRDRALAEYLRHGLGPLVAGREVQAHFSGDIPIGLAMVHTIVSNQLRSIALTYLAVALLLVVVYPRGRAAFLALVPVTAATLLVFAGMGYAAVPLGVATSMFGSLVLGVGVDFSIHFLDGYRQRRARFDDARTALLSTLAEVGTAIRWNTVVLALGFAVLALSALRPNRSLGLLLAAGMVTSYGMTLVFLPGVVARLPNGSQRQPQDGPDSRGVRG